MARVNVIEILSLLFVSVVSLTASVEVDPKGYILYCPCMGRFGNQVDQFLGALAFARGLDRILVLPPWVEYPRGERRSKQVPFKTYFKVEPLREYVRVMTMEHFMEHLAPKIWIPGNRTVYCYGPRGGTDSCNAKDGNPFGPFWDTFNIDFDNSKFVAPLYFDTYKSDVAQKWNEKFPVEENLVMAFTGTPSSFPAAEENVANMKYVFWSDQVQATANTFIKDHIAQGPWLGIHLRNGVDFKRACEHVATSRNLFGSSQCLGHRLEHGQLTQEMCLPSENTILKQIKKMANKIKAKTIFVATDDDPMISKIEKHMKGKVKVVQQKDGTPHVDLALLSMADHFIGNCVSTFTAVATRYRRTHGNKPTSFWAFKPQHDEL